MVFDLAGEQYRLPEAYGISKLCKILYGLENSSYCVKLKAWFLHLNNQKHLSLKMLFDNMNGRKM